MNKEFISFLVATKRLYKIRRSVGWSVTLLQVDLLAPAVFLLFSDTAILQSICYVVGRSSRTQLAFASSYKSCMSKSNLYDYASTTTVEFSLLFRLVL